MALNLPFTQKLLKKADPESEELSQFVQLSQETRDDLRSSQAQFDVYATTVNQNLTSLKEFAKGDIEKEERLNRLVKNLSNEDLVVTLEKIEGDEKVSVRATQDLLEAVKTMKNDVTHMEAGIQLSVGNVVNEYKRQITNDSNSTDQQMKVLNGLLSVMSKEQQMLKAEIDIYSAQDKKDMEEEQLKRLESQEAALKKLKTDQVNLSKFAKLDNIAFREHSGEVERLLDEASDQNHRSRLLTSLTNVDTQLEQLGIDSKQLTMVTQKLDESTKDQIAGAKERGKLDEVKTTMKEGAVAYLLEGLGLGGLDKAFGLSEKVGNVSVGGLFGRKGRDGQGGRVGRDGKRKGGLKGLLGRATGMLGGGNAAIKQTEEYQGTRQALEDVGVGGRGGLGGRDKRSRRKGGSRRSRRSRRGGKFGRFFGGAASLLGLGGAASMFGGDGGSSVDSVLDTVDMAGDAKDLVSRKSSKKVAEKAAKVAAKKASKGAGKKLFGKGAAKVAGKGALQVGGKAAAALGPVAAVAGAGFAGWQIGSFINKVISEKTGREDWLFSKMSDRREVKQKADQETQMREKYAPKFKKMMTPTAFELVGGDDNFDIKRFVQLRSSKAIISNPDQTEDKKWISSDEASKKIKGTIQKLETITEQDQGITIKEIDQAKAAAPTAVQITEQAGAARQSLATGKKVAQAVVESSPDILKDTTVRVLEVERQSKQILAGIAGNTAQAANVSIQPRTEASSTDRKLNINDAELIFIRSVLMG